MRQWIFDIASLFFPLYCPVCGMPMHIPHQVICLKCEQRMPKTNFFREEDNPVAQLFWGRVKLEGATSLFRFEKGSKYQSLLHLIKYKGAKKIGIFLGALLGKEILNTPFQKADYIVPLPLHRLKEKKRGYNQSMVIAEGISKITGIPINNHLVYRNINTDSQTQKNRFERWENMENVFCLYEEIELKEEPVFLLIDDVVTTGSTIEACAGVLLSLPGASVYVATIACA